MRGTDLVHLALSWLGTYALHSTLFLGGVWALCALRPPRALRLRERLWKLALVGGVASASLQLAVGARPLLGRIVWHSAQAREPVRREESVASLRSSREESAAERGSSRPSATDGEPEPAPHGRGTEPAAGFLASSALDSSPEQERTREPLPSGSPRGAKSAAEALDRGQEPLTLVSTEARNDAWRGFVRAATEKARAWPTFVLTGWTAFVCLGLAGVLASWTVLRRRLLGRRELRDGPLFAMLEELRARAGLRSRVRLTLSPRLTSPITLGILRPEICVPAAALNELTLPQQQAMLAHEIAHTLRRDSAWFGVYFLVEKLFFFQPLNRIARANLVELAEVACDDWAVRWTGARLALASCLTEVARWILGDRPRTLALPGLTSSRSRLGRRIERLLDDRRSPASDPRAPWWPPLAAGALALFVLAIPGISAEGSTSEARAPSSAPDGTVSGAAPVPVRAPTADLGPATPDVGRDFEADHALLLEDLRILEREIAELRAELENTSLLERFEGPLALIELRMSALRSQHERVTALLASLTASSTSTLPREAR